MDATKTKPIKTDWSERTAKAIGVFWNFGLASWMLYNILTVRPVNIYVFMALSVIMMFCFSLGNRLLNDLIQK